MRSLFAKDVFGSVRFSLAVAVWAERPQVFEAVIVWYTIDVVDLDADSFAPPLANSTFIADVLEYTSLQQADLDRAPASRI